MDAFSFNGALIQTPMRSISTPELVINIAKAGSVGTLDVTDLSPHLLRKAITDIQSATAQPFIVHLTVPQPFEATTDQVNIVSQIMKPYFLQQQLDEPTLAKPYAPSFAEQMQAVLEARITIVQFSGGIPALKWIAALKEQNVRIIGTATNLQEATVWGQVGADAIVAQGVEAYGERSTFIGDPMQSLLSQHDLVDCLVGNIELPVIANGGIQTRRDIDICFANGASSVQVGGVFAVCNESNTSAVHKQALLTSRSSMLSAAVTGRLARVVENDFINAAAQYRPFMLPYPLQYALMKPLLAFDIAFFTEQYQQPLIQQSVAQLCHSLSSVAVAA
ncbi:MAG: nitronate monooxygenase [Mariprofundaceae bacterium]|nr:nitronate monooxygenase [Mariprofundaceae bacterium]